jgi:tRNA-specific 2-thiouridylase
VRCNTFTKFRDLVETANRIDASYVATGHYARIGHGVLRRGVDESKDQTYFLWGIDRAVLSRMMLPVGTLTKPETRALAAELGLMHVAQKPESQEICFVPGNDYADVLVKRLGADHPALQPGRIVTTSDTVVGEHDGFARFTVGQRRGLPGGFGEPMYVVGIRPETREVVVGERPSLMGKGLIAREVNWLVPGGLGVGDRALVRVRHRAPLVAAELIRADNDEIELALDEPIAAITAGQSVVLYDDDGTVLGGGFIEAAKPARAALPILKQ